MATDLRLDARGLRCPLPVLKLEKALAGAGLGQVVVLLATDPMAKVDVPLFCRQNGHSCAISDADGVLTFTITAHAENR